MGDNVVEKMENLDVKDNKKVRIVLFRSIE